MKAAMHQPHYFPWLGYMDKMAKCDIFVLLDEAQLTDSSNMFRNKFLSSSGREKYLTVSFLKPGYMQKKFMDVELNHRINWQKNHVNFLKNNYIKSPYFKEVWENIECVFSNTYSYICDVAVDSLKIIKNMLKIPTRLILQSELIYDKNAQKTDLVLEICRAVGADQYLSGRGARKYMELPPFAQHGIEVRFQKFTHPVYPQINSEGFVPNLSSLDFLFNCGIEKAGEIFWNNIKAINEFDEDSE
ncbi:MAG: WbqC family protein [Oscillospiraceae bacterium]|jgi:hypothetical protein